MSMRIFKNLYGYNSLVGSYIIDWNTSAKALLIWIHSTQRENASVDGSIVNDAISLEESALFRRKQHLRHFLSPLLRFKAAKLAWNERFPGWRGGIAGFATLASIILLFNLIALTWAPTHLEDGHYATVAVGSHEKISDLLG